MELQGRPHGLQSLKYVLSDLSRENLANPCFIWSYLLKQLKDGMRYIYRYLIGKICLLRLLYLPTWWPFSAFFISFCRNGLVSNTSSFSISSRKTGSEFSLSLLFCRCLCFAFMFEGYFTRYTIRVWAHFSFSSLCLLFRLFPASTVLGSNCTVAPLNMTGRVSLLLSKLSLSCEHSDVIL